MDSLTQIALGSAIGVATMGRRTAVWKAALVGAVAGTLPDLDVFINHGDPVRNMTLHRADTHSLLYLTLFSPLLAWLCARWCSGGQHWRRWWLATWLVLITHPLLDWMTVYGTQLLRPWTDYPYAVGSIFVIDPLYTLPLLIGTGAAFVRQQRGLRWNALGLLVSACYLIWSVVAQERVMHQVNAVLQTQVPQETHILVTPTAFNTLLWRVVVMTPDSYQEGYYSLLSGTPLTLTSYPNGHQWMSALPDNWAAQRIRWFSHGFYKVEQRQDQMVMTDLRFGMEPDYNFQFVVASKQGDQWAAITPIRADAPFDAGKMLSGIWARLLGRQD